MGTSLPTRPNLMISLALVLITLMIYGQTYTFEFINLDDQAFVQDNPRIRQGFTADSIRWALTASLVTESPHADYWQPVTLLSRILDVQLFGRNPGGHHLSNLILHALNSLILFALLRRMTNAVWPSAFVAAVFAAHPLQVESVAWVTERKDVLSAFFGLITIWLYVDYARQPSRGRYLLFSGVFLLALMSKPSVVALPILLLLLDYWPLQRLGVGCGHWRVARQLLLEKVPLLGMAALVTLVTRNALPDAFGHGSPSDFLTYIPASYGWYIVHMLWPSPLVLRSAGTETVFNTWQVAMALIGLICVTGLIVWQGGRRRYLAVGWFWFIVALGPVVGLTPHADRFTYFPMIGLLVLVAWGVTDLTAHRPRFTAPAAGMAGLLLVVYTLASWFQTRNWKDSVTLFQHAMDGTTDNWVAHNCLGIALLNAHDEQAAITHFRESIRINPGHANTFQNLGTALAKCDDLEGAIAAFQRAIELDPGNAAAHTGLGRALYRKGETVQGLHHLYSAVRLHPEFAEGQVGLAIVLAEQGRTAEAVKHYREALKSDPGFAMAHCNLGLILSQQGNFAEATTHLLKAVQLKPDYAKAQCSLGLILGKQGRIEEAVGHLTQAVELDPGIIEAHFNLGVAWAQKREWSKARKSLEAALAANPNYQPAREALARVLSELLPAADPLSKQGGER